MEREVKRQLSFLIMTRDPYPSFRVDLKVLFNSQMVARGHKIDWIMQIADQKEWQGDLRIAGGEVFLGRNDNGARLFSRIKKYLFAALNDMRVFSLVRAKKYDFIQVKDLFFSAVLALMAARFSGRRYFYWLSYPFPEALLLRAESGATRFPFFTRLQGYFTKWCLYGPIAKHADHMFVQSTRMKADLVEQGVSPSKMTVVPMGVNMADVEEFDRYLERSVPTAAFDRPTIVYLGTLTRDRHLDFLVDVLAVVKKEMPDTQLLLVGRGETKADEDFLRQRARDAGLQNDVIMTGFLPMRDAWQKVVLADVCVSPFRPSPILDSTSPTKLIEYMALNKSVVANDHPDQSIVLRESGAGYCVPYDAESFANAIVSLLKDPEGARRMASRGRAYVEKHRSYEQITANLECKYFELVSEE